MEEKTVQALCSLCRAIVPARYVWADSLLILEKECPIHGKHAARVTTEKDYWAEVERVSASVSRAKTNFKRRPLMLFVEVIDECDLECKTCIAGSLRGAGNPRSPSALVHHVSSLANSHGPLDLILLTGGEPTLHNELPRIASDLAHLSKQVVLITNGVRIASDRGYVRELHDANPQLHVYLQFDSLRPEALNHLRGSDLSSSRRIAVENLGLESLTATLVSIVKSGVNDQDIIPTVEFAMSNSHVIGVTFQPVRASGRHTSFDYEDHHVTLAEVRRALINGLALSEDCIRPHPADPYRVAIGYFDRTTRTSLTQVVLPDIELEKTPLYLTPQEHLATPMGEKMFRLAVISYYDQHDIVLGENRPEGMVFLRDGGGVVSLEERFLFPNTVIPVVQPSKQGNGK